MSPGPGWRELTLGDLEIESAGIIQTGPFGSQLHASDYSTTGTPVVMPTNIRGLRVDPSGIARVSDAHVARLARHKLRAGDIVYSRRGDVEKCALIQESQEGWLCGTGCLLVRVHGPNVDARCLSYLLSLSVTRDWISRHAVGATMPNLNTGILRAVPVFLPPMPEQQAIAATLGALDDKIESSLRARSLLRDLGKQQLNASIAAGQARQKILKEVTTSISRGVTPKYSDGDLSAPLVLNQKCVRDNWVFDDSARRMVDRTVADTKRVASGDILVNSTGTGTLGRVGRWHEGGVFADSHVSIVKPDPDSVGPTVLAYALFEREDDIENLATGSTGQTELSPARLGELNIELPREDIAAKLEPLLLAFENLAASLRTQEGRLADLRDTLLAELLSGRLRTFQALASVEGIKA